MKIKIKLDEGATMPTRATSGSVGYDVTCMKLYLVHDSGAETICETVEQLKEVLYNSRIIYAKVDTGVHITPPDGYYVDLVPNSRQGKTPLNWNASIGVIDPDYTGSIKIMVSKTVREWTPDIVEKLLPYNVVGQLIIRKKYDADFIEVDELDETERGDGGFGSTACLAQNA